MSIREIDETTKKILQQRGIIGVLFYFFSITIVFSYYYLAKVDFHQVFGLTALLGSVFLIWVVLTLKTHFITIILFFNFLILLIITLLAFFPNELSSYVTVIIAIILFLLLLKSITTIYGWVIERRNKLKQP